MSKRVFIIHGWDGHPNEGWFPWLKTELEKRGFAVQVPEMPDTSEPKINEWVSRLKQLAGKADKNTYFVGHSIGCQAILRYFESLDEGEKAGGAVFVAGWFTLKNLETEEEWETARPWLEIPVDFNKVRQRAGKFVAIFSDNDEFVPMKNKIMFEKKLGAKTALERQKGHFREEDGVKELPSALKAVLEIAKL
ncbi:MAG: alpha/beta hydrolase [bacterium]|nr:alpha/beta hydrolase [bacterium]